MAIRAMAINGKIMGSTALIGLLVTGVTLTFISYSFFPFSTLPWLALKQTVYVIVLLVAILGTIPRGEKIHAMAVSELAGSNAALGASAELRQLVSRQFATVMIIGFFVLINMSLGESKAMMWAH